MEARIKNVIDKNRQSMSADGYWIALISAQKMQNYEEEVRSEIDKWMSMLPSRDEVSEEDRRSVIAVRDLNEKCRAYIATNGQSQYVDAEDEVYQQAGTLLVFENKNQRPSFQEVGLDSFGKKGFNIAMFEKSPSRWVR